MLQVNVPVIDTFQPKGNKIVSDVKVKATGESKLNDCMQLRHVTCEGKMISVKKSHIDHFTDLYHCNIAPVIAIPPGTWKDMRPKIFILSPVSG